MEFVQGSAGGAYFIGSSLYAGNGGGGGDGSPIPNSLISFSFQVNQDTLFQVADAGGGYNPFILDLVLGSSPYSADWSSAYNFTAPSIPWTAGADGSLTVTYNYTPEPSTFGLLGTALVAGFALSRRRTA